MFNTILHFLEGLLFTTIERKPEITIAKSENRKDCCKKTITEALENQEYKDIFKATDKTVIIGALCETCKSYINIAVNCKKL